MSVKGIPVGISNFIHYQVWDKINNPFPNVNGCTVEIWEWMTNFILSFTGQVIGANFEAPLNGDTEGVWCVRDPP